MYKIQLGHGLKPGAKIKIIFADITGNGKVEIFTVKRKTQPHWYYTNCSQCLYCGKRLYKRSRKYTTKPKSIMDRYGTNFFNCGCKI